MARRRAGASRMFARMSSDKTQQTELAREWGGLYDCLSAAFAAGDRDSFTEKLDRLGEKRNQSLFKDVREASDRLRAALDQFQLNSRLANLAGKEVPDARLRLDHALKIGRASCRERV